MSRIKLFEILISIAVFVLKQCWHIADDWIAVHRAHGYSERMRINQTEWVQSGKLSMFVFQMGRRQLPWTMFQRFNFDVFDVDARRFHAPCQRIQEIRFVVPVQCGWFRDASSFARHNGSIIVSRFEITVEWNRKVNFMLRGNGFRCTTDTYSGSLENFISPDLLLSFDSISADRMPISPPCEILSSESDT